jgi:hypothetical protein
MKEFTFLKLHDAETIAKGWSNSNPNTPYCVVWGNETIDKKRICFVKVWKDGDDVESMFVNGIKIQKRRQKKVTFKKGK